MKLSIRARALSLAAFIVGVAILVIAASIVADYRLARHEDLRVAERVVQTLTEREAAGTATPSAVSQELAAWRAQLLGPRLVALALGGLVAMAFALALAWRIARRIETPLESLRDAALRLATGDASPPDIQTKGHTAEVARAIERIAEHLRDREAAARWLDAVLDSMGDAVFVTAADGEILRVNAAANAGTACGSALSSGRRSARDSGSAARRAFGS